VPLTGKCLAASVRTIRRAPLLAVVLGIVGSLLTIVAFGIARRSDNERVLAVLELRADWRTRDIERKLTLAVGTASSLAGYLAGQPEVTASQFESITRLTRDPEELPNTIYWAPWVTGSDRAAFVAAVRRDADAGFDIRDSAPSQTLVPAGERAAYLPVLYEQSFDGSSDRTGYDLLHYPGLLAAMEKARDEGKPVMFPVLQGSPHGPTLITLLPVSRTEAASATSAQRHTVFSGLVVDRFRLEKVLPQIFIGTPDIVEAMTISIGLDGAGQLPVATYDQSKRTFDFEDIQASPPAGGATLQRQFMLLGSYWTIDFVFAPADVAELRSTAPLLWLGFGLLLTVAASFYAWRQAGVLDDATTLVRETNDRFRYIFDNNPIGMVLATAGEFRLVRVNTAFAHMLGYEPDELEGRLRDEISAPESQNMPPPTPVGANPDWFISDKHYVSKNGQIVVAQVRVIRLPPATGETPVVLGLAENVTEQRKTEATLRQMHKLDAIGQLTGGIAHDFNNLLGVIIGDMDFLHPLVQHDKEAVELVEETLATAERGADLTRRLLAFARQQPLDPTQIAVNEQVIEIAALLRRALGEDIRIELELADDLWPVIADRVQLETCLINLATNARDAMPHGGVLRIGSANRTLDEVYCRSQPDVQPGDYAMVEITDTGTGMTPQVLAQVFEPFFTTKTPGKGTGLGLSMVFGFMKQSNGHINVYSEPGVGTTFRLYLPRLRGVPEGRSNRLRTDTPRGGGETVLVVEDNAPLRHTTVRHLVSLGYDVIEAESAEAAVAVLQRQPVSMVFSDVVLSGGLDGSTLAERVHQTWPTVKVLLTSGFAGSMIKPTVDAVSGRAPLLAKPYRADELARAVREALDEVG
jgi:PAS domain S-box-containing protein